MFFDLPVLTDKNRRDYRMFRKNLIKSGFVMMQESVYCKLAQNSSVAETIMTNVRSVKPPDGLIQMLCITEKQFSKMEYVLGMKNTSVIDSDERLVIL